MNNPLSDRERLVFPMLVQVPLGLLLASAAQGGPAFDLLVLGQLALAGWLGGHFVAGQCVAAAAEARTPARRPRFHRPLLHHPT